MKRINLLVAKINYPDSPTVVRFHTLQPEANNLRASKNQATVGLFSWFVLFVTAAGLAQSLDHLTAERKVAGWIPGAGPILRVLK